MRTERAAVFLFAHQDDEFGVYQRISDCTRTGLRVYCAYLTDGATATASAAQRNAESLQVLGQLGVARGDVVFAGEALGIGDARLPLHMDAAGSWLATWLAGLGDIESLHVTAWEGGHHDHDALHALAVSIAHGMGMVERCWQYPLYHGKGCPGPLFRTLAPIAENGPVTATQLQQRLRDLRLCLSYPSQRATWLGLFPFVVLHYLFGGVQSLQGVSLERTTQRPHAGPLYYEKRNFFTWPQMQKAIAAWRAGRDGNPLT